MVFCGQCGYQLAPGDIICPHCGAQTEAGSLSSDPGTDNPTEISHAIQPIPEPDPLHERVSQARLPINKPRPPQQQSQPDRLILGPVYNHSEERLANEPTAQMSAPTYAPQPQQAASGLYGQNYNNYPQPYQGQQVYQGQSQIHPQQAAALEQMLTAIRKGKMTALILVLFGLLALSAAVAILLLTLQGTIFSA